MDTSDEQENEICDTSINIDTSENKYEYTIHLEPEYMCEDKVLSCQNYHNLFSMFAAHVTAKNFCYDIMLSHKIIDSGVPNRYGCRIPLHTNWNLKLMKSLIVDYNDQEIIDWLTFGFSISRDDNADDPIPATQNHTGATAHPEAVDQYICKELKLGATMGPFLIPPYLGRIGISLLSTREKRGTTARRII